MSYLEKHGYAEPPRYKVSYDNVEHRCCHEANVVDTHEKDAIGHFYVVCACASESEAEKIAAALNLAASPPCGADTSPAPA
jgi:hypothetical protein